MVVMLTAPTTSAHGDAAASVYDPLDVTFAAWPTPGGALSWTQPAAPGAAPFRAIDPATQASPPLVFGVAAPFPFVLGHGLDITLQVTADKPVLARDADGNALELRLFADGKPVSDPKRVALSQALLAPGDKATAHIVLQAPSATFAKGANLTLQIVSLVPNVADGSLSVATGPGASHVTFDSMRLASLADLELEEPGSGFTLFNPANQSFAPSDPNAVVVTATVTHESVTLPPLHVMDRNVYLVFIGAEDAAAARAAHDFPDRERRIAAAHEFTVGARTVRVVPGMGVIVPLGRSFHTSVVCARNCPAGLSVALASDLPSDTSAPGSGSGTSGSYDDSSVLIPPPRPTSGIPVSSDAPAAQKQAPGAGVLALVLACSALVLALPRRRP